jgi:hypothetical protein
LQLLLFALGVYCNHAASIGKSVLNGVGHNLS